MIGFLWTLTQVATVAVMATGTIGVFTNRAPQWWRAPWFWLIAVGLFANTAGRYAGAGHRWLAAATVLMMLAACWFLALTIVNQRTEAARRRGHWDPAGRI